MLVVAYDVVRVMAPDEELVESFVYEHEAVGKAAALDAEAPVGVYHEVRDGSGRVLWTSEAGALERFRA